MFSRYFYFLNTTFSSCLLYHYFWKFLLSHIKYINISEIWHLPFILKHLWHLPSILKVNDALVWKEILYHCWLTTIFLKSKNMIITYDNAILSCLFSWNSALVKTCKILRQSICSNIYWSVFYHLHGAVTCASYYPGKKKKK